LLIASAVDATLASPNSGATVQRPSAKSGPAANRGARGAAAELGPVGAAGAAPA